MAGYHQALACVQFGLQARYQPCDRSPDLGDDLAHGRGRRERVLDQRNVDVMRERTCRDEGIRLFVVQLPIPAMQVGEGGAPPGSGMEEIQPLAWSLAVGKIPVHRGAGIEREAALVP